VATVCPAVFILATRPLSRSATISGDVACSFTGFLIELRVSKAALFPRSRRLGSRPAGTRDRRLGIFMSLHAGINGRGIQFWHGVGSTFYFIRPRLWSVLLCKPPMAQFIPREANILVSYFSSKFHISDSLVIVVAFGVDVGLHGLVEELGPLVVVLRLRRLFKIIEELESTNQDTLEEYEHEIERLRQENTHLRQRLNAASGSTDPYELMVKSYDDLARPTADLDVELLCTYIK
jgi:hypothetical protein